MSTDPLFQSNGIFFDQPASIGQRQKGNCTKKTPFKGLEVAFYQWQLFRFLFVIYLVCIFFLGLKIHVNGMHVEAVGQDGSTILQNIHFALWGSFHGTVFSLCRALCIKGAVCRAFAGQFVRQRPVGPLFSFCHCFVPIYPILNVIFQSNRYFLTNNIS